MTSLSLIDTGILRSAAEPWIKKLPAAVCWELETAADSSRTGSIAASMWNEILYAGRLTRCKVTLHVSSFLLFFIFSFVFYSCRLQPGVCLQTETMKVLHLALVAMGLCTVTSTWTWVSHVTTPSTAHVSCPCLFCMLSQTLGPLHWGRQKLVSPSSPHV